MVEAFVAKGIREVNLYNDGSSYRYGKIRVAKETRGQNCKMLAIRIVTET